MLYLAKILPSLVLPPGLAILLLMLSLALRRRALAVAALAVLWLSSTPLISGVAMRAAEGWQVRRPLSSAQAADAVVVLSGIVTKAPGVPAEDEWMDGVDRFDAGVALVREGKAPLLVFTGGWLPWYPDARPEGEVLREKAVTLGIARDRIVVTGKVRNTAEEAEAVSALLRSRGHMDRRPSIILVTSAFHMRRSRLLFSGAGLSVTAFPVDFRTSAAPLSFMHLLPTGGSIENAETALRELYGYLYYRLVTTRGEI